MPPFRATYREEKEELPHSITALFRKRFLTAALKTEGVQGIRWSRLMMPGFFIASSQRMKEAQRAVGMQLQEMNMI